MIKKYLDDLLEYAGSSLEVKKDFYAASMICFSLINEMLRLAELFMSKKSMPAPLTYKEMFDMLSQKGIISEPLARKMKWLVTKRNLLAHEYGQITKEEVRDLIKNMNIAREFADVLLNKK